jgi:histone H3
MYRYNYNLSKEPIYRAFKKPGIKRIARSAGVVRLHGWMYEAIRGIAKEYLYDVIENALIFMEYRKSRTLQYEDVKEALKRLGFRVWAVNKVEKSNTSGLKRTKKKTGTTKPRRTRRGSVAVREVKKYSQSTKLLMSRAGMDRLVRQLIGDFMANVRLSPRALSLLHVHIEDRLKKLLGNAQLAAIHAARKGVKPNNLYLALRIKGEGR